MKLNSLVLVIPALLIACSANAEVAQQKTDAISELHKPFYKAQQKEDAQRIDRLEDVTGMEWFQMPIAERMDQISASMSVLSHHGVPMRKSMNDYYNAVSEKLRINPGRYDIEITNVLASILYEKEPRSREALDKYTKLVKAPKKD